MDQRATACQARFRILRGLAWDDEPVLYDAERPENSSVTVVIEGKSIHTGSDHRDDHLRSDDFFDVDRYPTIHFQSREVRRQGEATDFERQDDPRLERGVARVNTVGVDSLIRTLRARAASDPKSLEGQEWGLDQVGRALLARHREVEGMKILRLNSELFPNSAATHTSLGRASELSGKRAEALAAYDRALEIDPDDPRAQEFRRRLIP